MFGKKKVKKKGVFAAVDIGGHSVKVMEVIVDNKTYLINRFVIREMPSHSSNEAIQSTIRAAVEEARLTTKSLHISISGPNAIVRFITMPEMSQQDLKNSLKYEADRYIPFAVDEVNIDSYILGKTKDGTGNLRVLLVAAKKTLIDKRLEMFRELGYTVSLVDISAFATFNAFLATQTQKKEDSIAILNLGHKFANLIIAKGETPYFIRDIQIGGEHIAKLAATQLGIDENEVFKSGNDSPEVNEAIGSALNRLGDEIRLSFGYYENQFGSAIDQIYLSGGLTRLNGIGEHLEENLGIKPELWNPLSVFTIEQSIDASLIESSKALLAVVCGLVLRSDVS